jgi:hypothetical protein
MSETIFLTKGSLGLTSADITGSGDAAILSGNGKSPSDLWEARNLVITSRSTSSIFSVFWKKLSIASVRDPGTASGSIAASTSGR